MLPEHAVLHHPPRPADGRSLLRRLEQEEHASRQFLPYVTQQPSRPYQHSRMGVVPAGVHHPVHLRDEEVAILLLYGQRVHIRPQGHGLARSAPLYHAEHARLGVARAKGGAVLIPTELRELVEMAPKGDDLFPVWLASALQS